MLAAWSDWTTTRTPRKLFCFALVVLLFVAVSRPAIRNAASLLLIEGYLSADPAPHWLPAEYFQRSAVSLKQGSTDESIRLARIVVALGRTEEGITLWKAAGQPVAPFLMLEIGDSLWQSGEQTRALGYWRLVPDLDTYFGQRGLASETTGDSVTALSEYKIGWTINDRALPVKGNALLRFCELLRRSGETSQAIATCQRARESGNSFWANMVLGILYSDQREFVAAEESFRQAQSEDPGDARANLWVGLSLASQGKLSQAMQFYRQGLSLAPVDGWLNYLMGKALWDSGSRDDARGYLENSVQFVPDSWEAAYLEDAVRLLSVLRP
jgi:tetratricopeptide (TPR) repeat protein